MITTDLAIQYIKPYTQTITPESNRFLYSGYYLKKKRRMKYALIVTALQKNLVNNDYNATFFNGDKTFSELKLNLIRYRRKKLMTHSLTSFSKLKKNILYHTNEIIFFTHRFMQFRNLTLLMSRAHYSYKSFNTFARLLNKQLFITILYQLKNFTFNFPCLIMHHFKKRKRLRIYYLGFKLFYRKSKMGLLLKGSLLRRHRFKREKRPKINNKKRHVQLYFKRLHV
jgi:hypothetical protein